MVQPGDKIAVFTDKEKIEGIYLEKPKILKQDTIIVKLKNGYNIGIDKEKIKSIKVIEEYSVPKQKKNEMKFNASLPTVTIISTGGTISSKVDYNTGGVIADYTAEDFVAMCPELEKIANIKAKKIMGIMSEDATFEDIKKMAEEAAKELEKSDGVVLTLGTDMLGYISAALSFALDVNKPVIITAAQKSIDRGSSDAFFNLICAVNAAAKWNGAEVAVCMHGVSSDDYCSLIKGTRVRKMHSSRRDAFKSINETEIAKVYANEIKVFNDRYKKRSSEKIKVSAKFEKKAGIVYVYPEMNPDVFRHYENYKGIIIMGTGLGHIPQNVYPAVKQLAEKGVFVGMTTQCIYGRVSSTVYSALRNIANLGVVYLEMLPETAFIKLCWLLGNNEKKLKERMTEDIKGEITERIEY